jgi:hypothetical protein
MAAAIFTLGPIKSYEWQSEKRWKESVNHESVRAEDDIQEKRQNRRTADCVGGNGEECSDREKRWLKKKLGSLCEINFKRSRSRSVIDGNLCEG